jgi:MYXO-CTERM domain-containing protein
MLISKVRFAPLLASLVAVIFVHAVSRQSVQAALTISSVVGGVPTGVNYTNFNNIPLGAAGGVSNGIGVTFSSDGQAVQGAASGLYAAPFLSNSNGALFGDPTVSGVDTTSYLSSGIGSVTLNLPSPQMYMGLLWGSVDLYNTLQFFSGATLVGTLTGGDVNAFANGDQGALGTFYVNINSTLSFDRVVASSTQYAFEFDNVALNPTPVSGPAATPEPASLVLWTVAGLAGLAAIRRRKCQMA